MAINILILLVIYLLAFGEVLYVSPSTMNNPNCDNLQDYTCSQSSPCDLYTALCKAANNEEDDTILLEPGSYAPSSPSPFLYKPLGLKAMYSITIKALDPNNKPIFDGTGFSGNLLALETNLGSNDWMATINISDLIFINTNNYGLYIKIRYATLNIKGCEFKNGNESLNITHENSYFDISGNIFDNINGFFIDSYSSYARNIAEGRIYNNTFKNIKKGNIIRINDEETVYIRGNYFSNSGTSSTPLTVAVLKVEFFSNEAGKAIITSNLFNDNFVTTFGTMHITNKGDVYIINNTFVNNTATSSTAYTGGVYIEPLVNQGYAYIYNNIFWNNTTPDVASPKGEDLYIDSNSDYYIDLYNNLFSQNANFDPSTDGGTDPNKLESEDIYISETTNYSWSNNITTNDPLFVGSNDYHIQQTSPAIDAGFNNAPFLPTKDFEGNPRIMSNATPPVVDIGADEEEFPTADLDVSHEEVNFGELLVGDSSNPFSITITNGGVASADLNITEVLIINENPQGSFSIGDNCSGATLAVGNSCTIEISFTAVAVGQHYAHLKIKSDDFDEPEVVVELRGAGKERFPDIEIDTTYKDFGNVKIGNPQSFTFTIQNKGTSQLDIDHILITDKDNFKIDKDNCSGKSIAPSASCTFDIVFDPVVEGKIEAFVYIRSNDPDESNLKVVLKGIVNAAPIISANVSTVDFGRVVINEGKVEKIIEIMNKGKGGLVIKSLTLTDTYSFSILEDSCSGNKIEGSGKCMIKVLFVPKRESVIIAKLLIESNAENSDTFEILLRGEGIATTDKKSTKRDVINFGCRTGMPHPVLLILLTVLFLTKRIKLR